MPGAIAENIVELNYIRSKLPILRHWALREFKSVASTISPEVILVHKPIDLYFIRQTFPKAKIIAVVHSFTVKHLYHADRVFAVSEALKAHIIGEGCEVPVTVINNAIDMPGIEEVPTNVEIPVVGTMAVLRRTKRLDMLIESFHQLDKQGVSFKGIIAGSGIQKFYLRYLIWRFNLKEKVELLSWVTDKDAFFREIDIFCISSRSETFSISLIEAMARRKSVVATACGGPNEIIEDRVDGLLTPVGNTGELTEKLKELIASKSYRDQLASAAYQKVKQRYSSEVIRNKIDQELKALTTNDTIN